MARTKRMPRARTKGLEIQDIGEEVLVYDLDRHRAHCLNPVAAAVWRRCDGRTSVARVASALAKTHALPASEETVRFAVERLRKARLLEVAQGAEGAGPVSSRRELLKKLGLTASAVLPAVISIVAPAPAHAQSCVAQTSCGSVGNCTPCFNPGGNCNPAWRCCDGRCVPPGQAAGQCGC